MNEYEWHLHFALLPRRIDGRWIWLRHYERKTNWYRPYIEHQRIPAAANDSSPAKKMEKRRG